MSTTDVSRLVAIGEGSRGGKTRTQFAAAPAVWDSHAPNYYLGSPYVSGQICHPVDLRQVTTERSPDAVPPAVARAARWLGLSGEQLDRLFLMHAQAASDGAMDAQSSAESKVIRIHRHLRPILGSPTLAKRWMRGHNLALDARPIDLISELNGADRIVEYLAQFAPR